MDRGELQATARNRKPSLKQSDFAEQWLVHRVIVGAQFMAARNGWIIANLCGDHKVIATGSGLIDAEQEALNCEISLQLSYVPDLPPCKRVVTVDPSGAIVPLNQQYSSARTR